MKPEISELLEEIQALKESNSGLIKAGLQYQKSFESAYKLLHRIKGLNDHPLWLEIRGLVDSYELIDHPTYGLKVIPK